ncbi:MAG: sulfite exporter TauE/SafE family protein [Magnetococcales bacterium]|nr:sulfite exporter TauE/SafE family protein [Magnetococcales bacterium]
MSFISLQFLGYLVTGLAAGVLAGLFGIGGGLVIVPALLFLFHLDGINPVISMQLAAGTSLATIIFTSLSATWNHHQRHSVYWPLVYRYAPGMVLGVWLGAQLAALLASDFLQVLFGLFEIAIGLRMMRGDAPARTASDDAAEKPVPAPQRPFVVTGVALLTGTLSALFGIGGGTLLVPALTLISKLTIHQAIGTSSAIGTVLALVGTSGMIQSGWDNSALPPDTLGFVVPLAGLGVVIGTLITAPIGVKLAHGTDPNLLKKGFGGLLLLVGIRLLWP